MRLRRTILGLADHRLIRLTTTGHIRSGDLLAYLASVHDCRHCPLKPNCCPKAPQRKVLRGQPSQAKARLIRNLLRTNFAAVS